MPKHYQKNKFNNDELQISIGQRIEFLYPGWVSPLYILRGTVNHKEVQGRGKNVRILYTVNCPSQEVFFLLRNKPTKEELDDIFFADKTVVRMTVKTICDCIKRTSMYSFTYSPNVDGVKIYYRDLKN